MKAQYLLGAAPATLLSIAISSSALAESSNNAPQTRAWEAVPSVIRSDGVDSFRLKVSVTSAVKSIYIEAGSVSPYLVAPESLILRDDGFDGDEVAGDQVYTSGEFHYNMAYLLPQNYMLSTDSPAGLYSTAIGMVTFEEFDGSVTDFLLNPEVGLLSQDIAPVDTQQHSENLLTTTNLINVKSDQRATQNYLRLYPGSGLTEISKEIYRALPDSFDFLIFFSNDKIESVPHQTSTANYHAGMHSTIQVNYSGTGHERVDYSHLYGSQGRLLGVNALDTFSRGINSDNAVHELLHQWSAALNKSLGLDNHTGHYNPRSNIGSVLGATYPWLDNRDGSYTIDCETGKKGLVSAAPLDKYLMGLIDGREVPTLRSYKKAKPHPADRCRQGDKHIDADDIDVEVTIEDIQSQHGIRTPGPADAQRAFNIGFVVESHGRFLNPTEITYYSMMAAHFTQPLRADTPTPAVSTRNWVSIVNYFGEGSSWSSEIAAHRQEQVSSADNSQVQESTGKSVDKIPAATTQEDVQVNSGSTTAAPLRQAVQVRSGTTVSLRGLLASYAASRRMPTVSIQVKSAAPATQGKALQKDLQQLAPLAVVVAPKSLIIEAENFSRMHGVKVKSNREIGQHSGAMISETDADDWLRYSVNIETAGRYTVEYRVASATSSGYFALDTARDLSGSGARILDNVQVPKTGGSVKWQTISRTITLDTGVQNLGLYVYGGDFNLDWIRISKI